MKTIFFASSLLSLLLLLNPSNAGADQAESAEWLHRSEIRFCETRGYDPDNMTPAQWDEYNDTWRGSVEEETAMTGE